jgi:hypothetical protein
VKIRNSVAIPNVSVGMHLLEIESVDVVRQRSFDDPNVEEDRIKLGLRVRTAGMPEESFVAWMSPRCSEKATFGSILKAVLGQTPSADEVETDELIGGRFRAMIGRSDKGWPRLVNGAVAPASIDAAPF